MVVVVGGRVVDVVEVDVEVVVDALKLVDVVDAAADVVTCASRLLLHAIGTSTSALTVAQRTRKRRRSDGVVRMMATACPVGRRETSQVPSSARSGVQFRGAVSCVHAGLA